MDGTGFRQKYGPWAFVAGGSVGLGGAYCDALAAHGLHIALAARRVEPLEQKAAELRKKYGVEVRPIRLDLAAPDLLAALERETDKLEVGMLVLNAALATVTPFLDAPLEQELAKLDVNCRASLILVHHFARRMKERRRGGVIVMSSGAGLIGMPYVATYSATKGFLNNLAEALWFEMKQHGVDVIGCVTGLTKTPAILAGTPELKEQRLGGYMEPDEVVREVLEKLGTRPTMSPGGRNKFTRVLLTRLLPRRRSIEAAARHHVANFMDK